MAVSLLFVACFKGNNKKTNERRPPETLTLSSVILNEATRFWFINWWNQIVLNKKNMKVWRYYDAIAICLGNVGYFVCGVYDSRT